MPFCYTHRSVLFRASLEKLSPAEIGTNLETHSLTLHRESPWIAQS